MRVRDESSFDVGEEAGLGTLDLNDSKVEFATAASDKIAEIAGEAPTVERRAKPRRPHQSVALLVADDDGGEPREVTIFTRDVDPNGSGFVSAAPMAEGEEATLDIAGPDGLTRQVRCRVRRSKALDDGWFEGAVEFLGEQPVFCETKIQAKPRRRPMRMELA